MMIEYTEVTVLTLSLSEFYSRINSISLSSHTTACLPPPRVSSLMIKRNLGLLLRSYNLGE
jgi:hypothetical protein